MNTQNATEMTPITQRHARWAARLAPWIAVLAVYGTGGAVLGASSSEIRTADEVMVAAVLERFGTGASVSLTAVDVPGPSGAFRVARPDPEGRTGKPMRFTLITASGTSIIAVATVHVATEHAVTTRAIARNETITSDDLHDVRDELVGAPLRRLPTAAELVGGRVLRPLPAGTIVLPGSVVVRRTIEPGDHVVVVALSGSVEVTAEMIAADGGKIGDLIRAVNPDTHQYVRGRVVEAGRIEVTYAR